MRCFSRSLVLCMSIGGACLPMGCGESSKDTKKTSEAAPSFSLDDFGAEYDRSKLVTWLQVPVVGTKARDMSGAAIANHVRLTFVKRDGAVPASVGRVRFWPYMSIHGHGTPNNGVVTPTADPHIYEVSGFVFTMGGKWELEVRVSLEGKAYALSIPVQVPEP